MGELAIFGPRHCRVSENVLLVVIHSPMRTSSCSRPRVICLPAASPGPRRAAPSTRQRRPSYLTRPSVAVHHRLEHLLGDQACLVAKGLERGGLQGDVPGHTQVLERRADPLRRHDVVLDTTERVPAPVPLRAAQGRDYMRIGPVAPATAADTRWTTSCRCSHSAVGRSRSYLSACRRGQTSAYRS